MEQEGCSWGNFKTPHRVKGCDPQSLHSLCPITLHLILDFKITGLCRQKDVLLDSRQEHDLFSPFTPHEARLHNLLNYISSHLRTSAVFKTNPHSTIWNPPSTFYLSTKLNTAGLPVDYLHVGIFIILWNWKFLEGRKKLVFLHRFFRFIWRQSKWNYSSRRKSRLLYCAF